MGASVYHVQVRHPVDLDTAAMRYVAEGYVVSLRDAATLTLYKRKEFNVLYAVIGFFLGLLPLLIYCIVYATQKDQMVVIHATGALPVEGPPGPAGAQLSPDGRYWWDGTAWQPVPPTPFQPPPS